MAADRGLHRAGFTLAEILVVLAVLAILSVIIVSNVVPALNKGQGGTVASNLSSMSDAINAFRQDIGRYPQRLAQLGTPITTSNRDVCGTVYTSALTAKWKGPYTNRALDATGLRAGDATIMDSIARSPTSGSGGSFGSLIITALNVDSAAWLYVEEAYDGPVAAGTGTIRWTSTGSGQGRVEYVVPIRGC